MIRYMAAERLGWHLSDSMNSIQQLIWQACPPTHLPNLTILRCASSASKAVMVCAHVEWFREGWRWRSHLLTPLFLSVSLYLFIYLSLSPFPLYILCVTLWEHFKNLISTYIVICGNCIRFICSTYVLYVCTYIRTKPFVRCCSISFARVFTIVLCGTF